MNVEGRPLACKIKCDSLLKTSSIIEKYFAFKVQTPAGQQYSDLAYIVIHIADAYHSGLSITFIRSLGICTQAEVPEASYILKRGEL